MALVEIRTSSGLVALQEAADEASVRRALKQLDPALRLVPQYSDHFKAPVYKVYIDRGGDTPAEFLCGWWSEDAREVYPLSHALVDMVRKLDRNERGRFEDPDERNRRLKEERYRDYRRDADEIVREYGKYLKGDHAPIKRTPEFALARRRTRRRITDPDFQP